MKKYCTSGQVTDDNKIKRMRIAYWINRVANTHSEFVEKTKQGVVIKFFMIHK